MIGTPPLVGLIMGSQSDWPVLQHAADILAEFSLPFESKIISAHRTPKRLFEYATSAADRGLRVIIAAAGGAAHLPGMTAALTHLPVLGVPMLATAMDGLDSLLSIVQMPAGVPVGTLAIGKPGAINAALLAVAILAITNPALTERLREYRSQQSAAVAEKPSDA